MNMRLAGATWINLLTLGLGASLLTPGYGSPSTPSCPCGFYDDKTKTLFTESIIVYFNETNSLPIPGFLPETYAHQYEKGWNTQFREGADPTNLEISNSSSNANVSEFSTLRLRVSPARRDHLVIGSSLRSTRRDIQYGSFTSLLRSPGQWAGGGGSALSMALQFNISQQITMNLQNTNENSTASVSMLANEEFPDANLGVPYGNMTNGTFGNGTIDPWDYTEFRMDWTKDGVKFYIGGHLARTITKANSKGHYSSPSPLYFKHWSNGNIYTSQGPPKNSTFADVGWVRGFFNSSSMTKQDHVEFGRHCHVANACLVGDITLRGSTPYSQKEVLKWTQVPKPRPNRTFEIWLAVSCIALTAFLLLNPAWKRIHEKVAGIKKRKPEHQPVPLSTPAPTMSRLYDSRAATLAGSANLTPANRTRAPSLRSTTTLVETRPTSSNVQPYGLTGPASVSSKTDFSSKYLRPNTAHADLEVNRSSKSLPKGLSGSENTESTDWITLENPPNTVWPESKSSGTHITSTNSRSRTSEQDQIEFVDEITTQSPSSNELNASQGDSKLTPPTSEDPRKSDLDKLNKSIRAPPPPSQNPNPKNIPEVKKRVDYLAGLVAVSSLLVTAIHFSLTFAYGSLNAGAFTHYRSEVIARKTINPFLLNLIWIGPFLMTSTRFLVSSYLRTGELLAVAEKTAGRTPRLMIPITAMVTLEYFLINAGATKWLEYLPSITWSTWPFTAGFTDFGNFLSEVIELMYLIPNAAPIITFNYCTGVLWTIPVQLQGSWLTILAVIVICEIKTPWKRFGFYAFCIINHWYALSWGSYFYVGILLTDLDITYKWRTYLHARPLAYYPLLLLCVLTGFAGLGMDLITQWTEVNYATYEYAIHPDINSGLPISQAGHAAYPQYFLPRLNGIAFAVGFQAAVEISPLIQKIFSGRFLVLVFPHIFTIYLLHGFIFWSLGAWLCITLAVHGLPYWANLLVVAAVCYTTIALCLPFLTPVVETLGKSITGDIWMMAREEPVLKKPTLWPFDPSFLLDRYETEHDGKKTKDVKIGNMKDRISVDEERIGEAK